MATFRPILISTVQYDSELRAKSISQVDAIAIAQRLGADGAELRAGYWHDKERELAEARRQKDELGMIVTYATDLPLFAADPAGSTSLRQALDDSVALGSPLVRVFPGVTPIDDDRLAWDLAHELVKDAAARGIVVALENFGRPPGCRLAEIQRVLDRIDSPALGTNVDIGNYASNGEDVPLAVRTLGKRIVSTHLRDHVNTPTGMDTTYLGGGTLPLPAILAELERLSQRVIHCFEFGGGGDPAGRIEKSLAYLRGW